MPCYYPVPCGISKFEKRADTGKGLLYYYLKVPQNSKNFEAVTIPCGRCIGCRLEKSRQTAIRCVHESSLYENNCFITLTYDDEHLPSDGSLKREHFQDFMKRLRDYVLRYCDNPAHVLDEQDGQAKRVSDCCRIRFLAAGEYGDNLGRPHYHALIFNYDFPDREFFTIQNGFNLFRSKILEKLWSYGYSLIGDVSFESAAYVARYVMKKVTGENADYYYEGRIPEFSLRSLKPGIGAPWLERYKASVYPDDVVSVRGGVRCKPPRYYDTKLNLTNPELYERIKSKRKEFASKSSHNTVERLAVRRRIKEAQLKMLKRRLN